MTYYDTIKYSVIVIDNYTSDYCILYNCCTCIFIIDHVLWVIHVIWTVIIFLQNWEIIHKPVGEYPLGTYSHAASVISGCDQEIQITIGGRGDGRTLNECWVINIPDNKNKKVLPGIDLLSLSSDDHVTNGMFYNTKFMYDLFCNINTILKLLYELWGLRSIHISTVMYKFVYCLAN